MLAIFGYISGLLSALCYLPYIRDIFLGKTKPERASWLIWTVLGGIAFSSQLAKGASYSLWLTAIQTIGVVLVFILSIKFGVGGFTRKDYIALLMASVGLLIWYYTQEAAYALFIVIAIDAVGALLTVHKAYKDPESETLATWILSGMAGLFALFSVGALNIVLLSYPIYIFVINALVVIAIYLGKRKK